MLADINYVLYQLFQILLFSVAILILVAIVGALFLFLLSVVLKLFGKI